MKPPGISSRLYKRMTALIGPIKDEKKNSTKEQAKGMRKSATVCVHYMPEPSIKESYTYDEMMATPGIYIAEGFKEVKVCVIKQVNGASFALYINENGFIEPLTPAYWNETKFYEANDDLMVIFARTV